MFVFLNWLRILQLDIFLVTVGEKQNNHDLLLFAVDMNAPEQLLTWATSKVEQASVDG